MPVRNKLSQGYWHDKVNFIDCIYLEKRGIPMMECPCFLCIDMEKTTLHAIIDMRS